MFPALLAALLLTAAPMSGHHAAPAPDSTALVAGVVPDSARSVSICQLNSRPSAYAGTLVVVEEPVKAQCPGGHWLTLVCRAKSRQTLQVDLTTHKLAVPTLTGSVVRIYGRFQTGKPNQLIAEAVVRTKPAANPDPGSCCAPR